MRLVRKLILLGLLLGLAGAVTPAQAQGSVPPLQLEIRKLRQRSDSLRAEVKRQQQAVGEARHRIEALETEAQSRITELQRLRANADRLWQWLWGLAALALLALLAALLRPAGAATPAPLAAARERKSRLHDGLEALEARVRAAEHGAEGDPVK